MNEQSKIQGQVERWIGAGLIDASTGSRIVEFETAQEQGVSLRWPVVLALVFGALLLAAGVTLFVAAHWDQLSPTSRFSLQLFMVAVFHVVAVFVKDRFPALATTFHGVGTATLGAAIFLTAQIFNLHENWPTGILLWAIGATAGYVLLKDWVQAAILALLVPSWLISQWSVWMEWHSGSDRPLAIGLALTAITYLSARVADQQSPVRRVLSVIGAIAILPCVGTSVLLAMETFRPYHSASLAVDKLITGWVIAFAGPLLFAWILRRRLAWMNLLFAIWAYCLVVAASHTTTFAKTWSRNTSVTAVLYLLLAIGAVGLAAWGVYEKRAERINLGMAGFALSVLFFYFDNFMDKLGRSAGLLILGLLCLAGGYVLEILRRRLMKQMKATA
jgi:uncharacterized membrane protein